MTTTHTDTIAAIATANGIGSIAIVRVSGSIALEIAKKLTKKDSFQPRVATLSNIYDKNDEFIDEAIVIYFKAPNSFTGEDIVEFQTHGGFVVSNKILKSVLDYGARIAEPGEFSKRAFLNDKIDLSKAEAIAQIIEAKSEDAAKILAKQLKGDLKNYIDDIRDSLIEMLAYSEVTIDYAEEDLPEDIIHQIQEKIKKISDKLNKTLISSKAREGLMQGFRVSIVGKPNVGKSSLLNSLLNYDRAIVSDIAGTTRDTIEEQVRIGSHLIKIVDTAGIREANDEIEKIGIKRSKEQIEQSDIVLALFDGSREFDEEDKKILELLENYSDKEIIKIKTKIDLEQKFGFEIKFDLELNTKDDTLKLIDILKEKLDKHNVSDEVMLISQRQIDAIANCVENLNSAYEPLEFGELEIFSFYINNAIKSLNSITKGFDNEEMLDKMFGSFCLGK